MAFCVTYTNGFDDYAALIRAKRSIGPLGTFGPVTPYLVVSALYLALVLLGLLWDGASLGELLNRETVTIVLAGIPIVVLFVAAIDFLFMRVVYRWVFRRFALANAKIMVRLDEDGIHWSGNDFAGRCAWSKVSQVVETKDRLFLFISKIEAVILPARALASDAAFQDLAAYAREHAHG